MAEIKTFSSAVDQITQQTGRPEQRTQGRIQRYVRQTYRECSGLQIFFQDLTEDQITADAADYVWTYPSNFRIMRTVKYPPSRFEIQFPPMLPPGKEQRDEIFYYYAGPGYYVFAGTQVGDVISLAYYKWPAFLQYYAEGKRPAIYNTPDEVSDPLAEEEAGEWLYLQSDGSYQPDGSNNQQWSAEEQEVLRGKVTNWLIFNWWDTVIEGGSTKTFNFLDDPRASKSYSLYKSFQQTLTEGEPYDSLGR